MSERPLRGEARRGLLLEAALRVIAAEGPAALTHRRVAAEAGLPLAATTYWFASKDELLVEAYRMAAARDVDRIEELAAATRGLDADRLGAALADLIATELTQHRATLMASYALWLESARRPKLREVERSWTDAYVATVATILERAGTPAPRDAARILVSAIDGLVLAELARDEPAGAQELRPLLDRLTAALLAH